MKNLILTITTTILFTATISATALVAPLDTINEKSTPCIFETNSSTIQLSNLASNTSVVEFEEEFIEEASKPSMVIVKPVAKNFTGFKVEITKAYHQPLDYTNEIFSTFDNIVLERVGETQFSYLTGEFKTAKQATNFITNSTSNKNLVVVQYKNGVRVK